MYDELTEIDIKKMEEKITKQENILHMESELNAQLNSDIEKCGEEIAVLTYIAKDATNREAELNGMISSKKNELGLYMITDISFIYNQPNG